MDIEHRFLPGDGYKVPAILIQPADPRGAAVIVHGYGENKEEQLGLGWRVAEAGLVVCVIDLRGHGEHSLPLDGEVGADLDAAIRFCRLFGKVAAIGHSFGGHLALLSKADYRIAISPSVNRPLSEHMQATLKTKRSYRVRPSEFAVVLAIHDKLPIWDPTQEIENTLILFAEWDIPEISSGCITLKNAGTRVVQIPKSTHSDILLSLKNRTKRSNSLNQKTKSFEMRSIYLKVNKPNPKFVVLKRVKIFLLKMRDEKESFYRTRNLNQNWIK